MTCSTQTSEHLFQENEKLVKEVAFLKEKVVELTEQIAWFKRQIFGQRSDKVLSNSNEFQPNLPGLILPEPVVQPKKLISAHERNKPSRDGKDSITLPDDLPVERQILDLPENEKVCAETNQALVKIGEEITRKLAHRPGSYFIKEIVRPKYALPKNEGIRSADLPEGLLSRCLADESFLADILTKKFADHLPFYRQSEILGREGIHIGRHMLSIWAIRVAMALKPLYMAMTKHVLNSGYIFADETPVDMLAPGKGKTHQAYMWVLVGGKSSNPAYRVYNFRTNRQHNNAIDLLKGFQGTLHSDKYGAYENLANTKSIRWCPCWVHIRRKFLEESGDPEFRSWVLRKMKYLFMLEKVAWARSPEERIKIRQEKEAPIIDELIHKIKDKLINGKVLPKTKFREALGYFCSLIPHLKNYTLDPWAHIDNNIAERAVRPLAIGRKNWMFVGSKNGGEAAAIMFTLVQTCRALKVNPREYLEDVMKRIMGHNSQRLEELLPDQWTKL